MLETPESWNGGVGCTPIARNWVLRQRFYVDLLHGRAIVPINGPDGGQRAVVLIFY